MNPNKHQAVETRRRALIDQIEGLERVVADGEAADHHRQRLIGTRLELEGLALPDHILTT